MFRTAFTVAIIGLIAYVAIRIVFGVAGGVVGLLLSLAWLVLKLALVGGLIYWLITVFSPETARKMREALRGESL
jgi:hypothetical protein